MCVDMCILNIVKYFSLPKNKIKINKCNHIGSLLHTLIRGYLARLIARIFLKKKNVSI